MLIGTNNWGIETYRNKLENILVNNYFLRIKNVYLIIFLGANMVSTVAGDGKLVSWDLRNVEKMMKGLKL